MNELLVFGSNLIAVVSDNYNNDPIMSKVWEYGFHAVLPKPYSFEDLKKILSKILVS